MRILVAFLLVALAGVLATGEDLFPDRSWARPVVKNLKSEPRLLANDDTCDGFYSCKDCKTARVCKPTPLNGVLSVVSEIACPSDRPYCDSNSGTCVSDAPAGCGGKDENFICMGNGKYPDKECTKFHVCVNYVPTLFECSIAGHTYNAQKQICEPSTSCGNFDCSSINDVKKAPHSIHDRYFAYCNKGANGVLVVDSCPPHFKLDSETQVCAPDCSVEGIIPDPTDCHFYYKCSQVTVARGISYMTHTRMMCPSKQAYSSNDFLCIDEQKVQTCDTQK